uniref:Secreted protein n=1 Tax=Panagrellus redivivus TaxID=6233 RepID=A0A7E4VS79_PANRE
MNNRDFWKEKVYTYWSLWLTVNKSAMDRLRVPSFLKMSAKLVFLCLIVLVASMSMVADAQWWGWGWGDYGWGWPSYGWYGKRQAGFAPGHPQDPSAN